MTGVRHALRSRGEATLPEAAHPRLGYRPDLDGLRALAVVGVLWNHVNLPNGTPSGIVGVTAFFVLSGYLITTLLLEERARTGALALGAFYRRRVRRLGPALLVVLAFVAGVGLLGFWRLPWAAGVAATLAYVANWAQVAGVNMGPLSQTWSLSIEEQFYLAWPLLLLLAGRRGAVAVAGLGIALAMILRPDIGFVPAYYSTFTRIDAIFAGCLLAIIGVRAATWVGAAGLVGLAALCVAPLDLNAQLPLAALATVAVIAGPVPSLGRLAALGRRAYEIYLWDFTLTTLLGGGIGGLAALPAAEFTYRATARLRRSIKDERPDAVLVGTRAERLGAVIPEVDAGLRVVGP